MNRTFDPRQALTLLVARVWCDDNDIADKRSIWQEPSVAPKELSLVKKLAREFACRRNVAMVLLREGARAIFGPDDPTGRSKWWDPLVHLYEQPLPITSATARSLYRPEMYWDDMRGVVLRTVRWRQSADNSDKRDLSRYRLGPVGLLEVEHRLLPIPFPSPLRSALRRLAAGASSYAVYDPCCTLRTADENPSQVLPRVGRRRKFHARTLRTDNAWLRWTTPNQVELDQAWKRFWAILTRWESKTPIAPGFRERYNLDPFRGDWVDLNFADRKIAAKLNSLVEDPLTDGQSK